MGVKPEDKDTIVGLLQELRMAELYGHGNEQEIRDCLARLGYEAAKPSKRAETRPKSHRGATR